MVSQNYHPHFCYPRPKRRPSNMDIPNYGEYLDTKMDEEIIKLNSTKMEGKEDSEDEIYEVEKIVGMSKSKGKTLFRVRWLGYDSSWDTWEPAENLETCDDLIEKYLEAQKKRRKTPAKACSPETTSMPPAMGSPDKDVLSEDSSDLDRSVHSESTDSKKKAAKGPTWTVVDSSDEEFETLKDTFWRDLEQGKVNVFKTDMYSSVKASGVRSSRPQSFKDMYKNKPLVISDEEAESKKERKKPALNMALCQEKGEKLDMNRSGGETSPAAKVKLKTSLGGADKAKTVTVKSPMEEEKCNAGKNQKATKVKASSAEKAKQSKAKIQDCEKKSKPGLGKDKKPKTGDRLPKSVVKSSNEDDSGVAKESKHVVSVSDRRNESDKDAGCTLKDTFWRDLEQGKIDVFQCDMYSKVKGSGARSSRPQSFKEMYQNKPLVQSESPVKRTPEKKKEHTETKPRSQELKKRSQSGSKSSGPSEIKKDTSLGKNIGNKNSKEGESSDLEKKSGSETGETTVKIRKTKPKPGGSGKFKSVKQQEKCRLEGQPEDSPPCLPSSGVLEGSEPHQHAFSKDTVPDTSEPEDTSSKPPDAQVDATGPYRGRGAEIVRGDLKLYKCHVVLERLPANHIALRSLELSKPSKAAVLNEVSYNQSGSEVLMVEHVPCNEAKIDSEKVDSAGPEAPDETMPVLTKELPLDTGKKSSWHGHKIKTGQAAGHMISLTKVEKSASCQGKLCSTVSDEQSSPVSDPFTHIKEGNQPRKKTESESSTEVPKKRKRKSESESFNEVPRKKTNLEFEEFTLDNFEEISSSLGSSSVSKLEIEEFTLEGFDNNEKTPQKDIANGKTAGDTASNELVQRPSTLPMDSSGNQTPSANVEALNPDFGKTLADDNIFDNSPVAGNEMDIDLLRRISEGTADRVENNNQEKDLKLDFIEFDISELDIFSNHMQAVQTQFQSHRQDSSSPQILNQVEFRHAVKGNEFDKVCQTLKHSKRAYDMEQSDTDGVTLAMICAIRGYDDMLELLARYGANINAETKNGTTALMMACEKNRLCTVAQLLHMGAYLNKETSNTCETALLKSVKRGFIKIASLLLDFGCNYNSPTREELCAARFAKNYQQRELLRLLNEHREKVLTEFESQVKITLNQTAYIKKALFPIQCLALNESDKFKICFKHELEPTKSGVGMLLFIAHARVTLSEVKCRFYGPCAVSGVVLNDAKLHPLTEEGNFVMSFGPLLNGKNELEINTARAPTSKAKLLVCAYTAQLA